MKDFLKEVFAYHYEINQKITEQILAQSSFVSDNALKLFCHSLNAHQIWSARILGGGHFDVFQIHELDTLKQIDSENYKTTLSIIESRALDEIISYSNSKGTEFKNSVQEILYHIVNHYSHHRGQIMTDFKSSGIDPIITDYIFYKR